MHRLAADHACHSSPSMHPDALAICDRAVVAADRAEVKEAVRINVMDHEADLVHMSCKHDPDTPARIDHSLHVAHDIRRHIVNERLDVAPVYLGDVLLVTAWRSSSDQVLKQI